LHMIEETARHAGHLDTARELLDGRTGLGWPASHRDSREYPPLWAQHRALRPGAITAAPRPPEKPEPGPEAPGPRRASGGYLGRTGVVAGEDVGL